MGVGNASFTSFVLPRARKECFHDLLLSFCACSINAFQLHTSVNNDLMCALMDDAGLDAFAVLFCLLVVCSRSVHNTFL
jgi:hypothetical protein